MIGNLFSSIARVGRGIKGGAKEADIGGFLSRQFGGSTIKQRALIGGGFFGAASLTGSYYDAVERQLSAYYGEEKYQEQYAAGVRSEKGMATFALKAQGVMGILGRDIISRGIGSLKYFSSFERGVKTVRGAAIYKRRGGPGSLDPRRELVGYSDKTIKTLPKPTTSYGDMPRIGLGTLAFGAGMALNEYTGAGVSPLAMGAAGAGLSALLFAGGKGTTMALTTKNDPARAREFGMVGKGKAARGAFILKRLGMTAAIMGAGGAAGYAQTATRNAPLAEGNIIDFSRHNESGVQRMNFSTAGLVQALHRSNSRY